jgi:hypothetical protein
MVEQSAISNQQSAISNQQSAFSLQPSAPAGGDVLDFRDLAVWQKAADGCQPLAATTSSEWHCA